MHSNGGFTFAENPDLAAPDARILWRADLDPGTLHIEVLPASAHGVERVDLSVFRPWLTSVVGADGLEYAVLSDGWHHIRLDLDQGTLSCDRPVLLRYHLEGMSHAQPSVLSLQRLIYLYKYRRFTGSLFPRDTRIDRWLTVLRTHDAVQAGASQRDIARALFGTDRVRADWNTDSESLRLRVLRLVADARHMAHGGYRAVLGARRRLGSSSGNPEL